MKNVKSDLNILMIISSFYPIVGGAEKQAMLLSQTLGKFGVKTTILTRSFPNVPKTEEVDGVRIIRKGVYKRSKIGSIISAWSWLLYVFKYKTLYNVFHAHQPFSSAFVAGIVSKITNKPSIVKIPSTANVLNAKLRIKFLDKFVNAFVVTNCESFRHLKKIIKKSKVYFIPNGVYFSQFNGLNRTKNKKEKIVLSVGRLEKRKGVDVLIHAWSMVVPHISNAKLVIVGSGSMDSYLKKLTQMLRLQDSIKFTGKLETSEVQKWYLLADCFVNPSFFEGISNSLLEAISFKIPVVVSKIPGNIDIINEERGWLFPPGDSNELAQKIIYVLKNPVEAKAKSELSYKYVYKNYSIEEIAKRYISLYKSLLSK